MGLISWLKSLFSKKDAQEDGVVLEDRPSTNQTLQQPERRLRRKYAKIPRTPDTTKYVQSIVKKAYSQDFKPKPFTTLPDAKEIERITNKLKEDSFKRPNFR